MELVELAGLALIKELYIVGGEAEANGVDAHYFLEHGRLGFQSINGVIKICCRQVGRLMEELVSGGRRQMREGAWPAYERVGSVDDGAPICGGGSVDMAADFVTFRAEPFNDGSLVQR